MTNDGNQAYAWDAENHIKSIGSSSYTYDGDGHRLMKSTNEITWYTPDGKPIAETDASGTNLHEYIYFDGRVIARRDPLRVGKVSEDLAHAPFTGRVAKGFLFVRDGSSQGLDQPGLVDEHRQDIALVHQRDVGRVPGRVLTDFRRLWHRSQVIAFVADGRQLAARSRPAQAQRH